MSATVMVVDDSLTVRMDLAEAFEEAGLQVVACGTLAQARERLAERAVDIVVLDLILPDGDGVDFLAELRASSSSAATPVLMLSSDAEIKDRIRALQIGADEYVGKPYDVSYVIARVQELLRAKPVSRAEPEPQSPVVLIIDDSITFRSTLRDTLSDAGYRVLQANDGEEGLRVAADKRPSAVIVDGHLPGIDGATVIRRIRLDAVLRSTPSILLTGSEANARDAELRALDAGADAFVRKDEPLTIVLARLAAVLRHATEPAHTEQKSLLGPKRILAVDDSATYLHSIADALRSDGYDIVLASSGEEALAMLAVQPVDCILMDRYMPGLDGEETCKRIKAAPFARDIPLIMLTADESREVMLTSLSAGADDFISKSSDLGVLKARVRAQMRRKQFESETRHLREDLLHRELEAAHASAARELAETRAVLVQELERKNRELEAFSYSVSHDLRAPLRSIDGFSVALLEDCAPLLDERGRAHLERVRAAVKRMGELIEDMLALSRISRHELRQMKVDLSALALDVLAALARSEPARQVQTLVTPDLLVLGDPRLLRVALENLLGNAWKFTQKRADARIEVGAVQEEDALVYFVRDNGAGFDMRYASKLFRPFSRLHTTEDFPGTGIGLATVSRVVDRHAGRIWAHSEIGVGTTFFFTLHTQKL